MLGRSLIKRARRRPSIGAWLAFGTGSAIPWRETRMPIGGPVSNSACSQGGSDCGKRIRPRQRHPPGRPCHPAIYGSARSAKPLPTSGADGLNAPRFATAGVSRPLQRSQYILCHTAIIINHAFLPRLCPEISTTGKSLQTGQSRGGSLDALPAGPDIAVSRHAGTIPWMCRAGAMGG